MKTIFPRKLAAALSLMVATLMPLVAQEAHLIAATNNITDVSVFPKLSQLPGKVPHQVWSGLPGLWAKHHVEWKTSASNDVGAVVFVGDSITEGWKTLAKDFPNLKVANRGIGGDISSGVLYRLKADVLSLHPKAIVLLIGTNDLGQNADPEDVAGNVRLILEAIKNYNPNLKVIICKVMPRGEHGETHYTENIKKLNTLEESFIKGEPNFVVCDTWSIYAEDKGQPNPADFNADLLHLNAEGYAAWKSTISPVIAKLNLSPDAAK